MTYTTSITRAALTTLASLALASTAVAQGAPNSRSLELRVSSGALVATGDQRSHIKDAQLTAAQLSWVLNPRLALNGTFSWARSRDLATLNTPKLDVFTADLGAELRSATWSADGPVSFSAFAGMGAGARTYNYRKLDEPATTNLAGYGSVGGEVGMGRVGLRVEVRDYATGFRPLVGTGTSVARNDVVIMGALRFNRRSSTQK